MEWVLRSGGKGDHAYVTKTWVGADGWHASARMLGLAHRVGHSRMVVKLLARNDTTLTVAAIPGESEAIMGWSCTGPQVCYYVYVRHELRRLGIGKDLLAHLGSAAIAFTHQPIVKGLPIPESWRYDPYANHPD